MESTWYSSASSFGESIARKMPASLIPPPITQSVYLPSIRRPSPAQASSRSPVGTPLAWYHRKQRNLEADLQLLLDAQAERLTSGPDPSDEHSVSGRQSSSSRSSTPTLYSAQDIPSIRAGKLSLKDARKGLYMTMRRLALLKQEETKDADAQSETVLASYDRVQAWIDRRERLVKRSQDIQGSTDADIAANLRHQAHALQPSIDDLEQQLLSFRNEQRSLKKEAEEVENRVQAKMSSYTRNLEMLDKDAKDFLGAMQPADAKWTLFSRESKEEEPFWALPAGRRTLDMAREVLEREKQVFETKHEQIETEREALEEGAVVWKDAVKDIEGFERLLREEMKKMSRSQGQQAGPASSENGLHTLLTEMSEISQQLESRLKLAETRGWKLLIAALGAELDAFRKGREVLESLASATKGNERPLLDQENGADTVSSVIHSPGKALRPRNDDDQGREIRDLDDAFDDSRPFASNSVEDNDEDDDGPDPELLITHHDTDDE